MLPAALEGFGQTARVDPAGQSKEAKPVERDQGGTAGDGPLHHDGKQSEDCKATSVPGFVHP